MNTEGVLGAYSLNLRVSWALLVVLLWERHPREPRTLSNFWNDGPAKQAILTFVKDTTEKSSPGYVEPADRIATFDQDGTLWTEHPLYAQGMFALTRVAEMAPKHPEWKQQEPFQVGACRRPRGDGQVHRGGLDADCRCDPRRDEHRSLSGLRERLASHRKGPAASTGRLPISSINPCWRSCNICAPTASERTSSPAVAPGVCSRLQRTSVWCSTGTGRRIKHRHDLRQ